MKSSITDQFWGGLLKKEPTRKERKRRYLFHGLIYYLIMCREYPVRALIEILACALILALMFGLLWAV